ncbi:hypothetical protein Tco_0863460 [Tanacetum coccineum]
MLHVWRIFLEMNLISQEFSGRDYDLEDDHMDTYLLKTLSEFPYNLNTARPNGQCKVRSKWVFKKKTDIDGNVYTYKARLVHKADVRFAQNLISRNQQNPGKLPQCFCDASWQCDKDDTKSQTGYVFIVNRGAVDWKSKKQTTIAMHATQSEYMASVRSSMESRIWIRKFCWRSWM